jgi:hypothetical protein
MDIGEFLSFRSFITPGVIMVVYILGALAITLFSMVMMFGGLAMPSSPMGGYYYGEYRSGAGLILFGVVMLLFGNIFWRIFCEYIIVIFRIHARIMSLDQKIRGP